MDGWILYREQGQAFIECAMFGVMTRGERGICFAKLLSMPTYAVPLLLLLLHSPTFVCAVALAESSNFKPSCVFASSEFNNMLYASEESLVFVPHTTSNRLCYEADGKMRFDLKTLSSLHFQRRYPTAFSSGQCPSIE